MSLYFTKNTSMRKLLLVVLIFLTGCSGGKFVKGSPVVHPKPLYHRVPEFLTPCVSSVNPERVRKRLEKMTGRRFRRPYFSYVTKVKGVYYIRYFYPLKHQKIYAGAEVWIECGKRKHKRIFYRFIPLE